jgi:NAD(P)-dependent dehydrogenase (short-subunit alcohol dehydrogenase family)
VLVGCRHAGARRADVLRALNTGPGGQIEVVELDVLHHADHRTIKGLIGNEYGHLDVLVNNAGINKDPADFGTTGGFNTTETVTPEALRETFETNFFGVVALTHTLLPLIRKSSAGRIVNLSSILGSLTLHGDPASPIYGAKAFAYDVSKTALNAYTIHLAHALKDTPIKVNSAHPGWVKTDMGGPNAPMELADGAMTSVHLATLGPEGPTGGYFHLDQRLPW